MREIGALLSGSKRREHILRSFAVDFTIRATEIEHENKDKRCSSSLLETSKCWSSAASAEHKCLGREGLVCLSNSERRDRVLRSFAVHCTSRGAEIRHSDKNRKRLALALGDAAVCVRRRINVGSRCGEDAPCDPSHRSRRRTAFVLRFCDGGETARRPG